MVKIWMELMEEGKGRYEEKKGVLLGLKGRGGKWGQGGGTF